MHLHRNQVSTSLPDDAREQRGLAPGTGSKIRPHLVATLHGRSSQGERDELTALVLDAHRPIAHLVQIIRTTLDEHTRAG